MHKPATAKQVQDLIEAAKLTQGQAALALGISQPRVSEYIHGKRNMPWLKFEDLAKKLGQTELLKEYQNE